MKHFLMYSTCLILALSCGQNNTSETPVSDDGWVEMLNENLTGWSLHGDLSTDVNNGILSLAAVEGQPLAMLISKESYDNFHLKFELQTADFQSNIMFRFNDKMKSTPERAGYILSTDSNQEQLNPVGSIVYVARSTIPESFDPGKWNTFDVESIGDLLSISINGHRVAVVNDKQFKSGAIALGVPSSVGETVRFRNMKIQPLATIAVITELLENRYRANTSQSWEPLFDGTTLSGWSPVGDGSWEVEDGAIHGYSGAEGGFLVSNQAYKNFYLKTQFKIIKEDNSGIFIRKSPDSTNVTIEDAIECNIYDHNGPSHAYSTGSIATHARAWYGMIDYQDWNVMEVFTEEDHIVMFVNGIKSSEAYVPSNYNKAGNICLQGGIKVFAEDKGPSDIYFKDITIKSFD